MKTYKLRTDPLPFQSVWLDQQTFQVRPDDEYEVGDILVLQETFFQTEQNSDNLEPAGYTGREVHVRVTHLMRGPIYGIMAGWVCLSMHPFFKGRTGAG